MSSVRFSSFFFLFAFFIFNCSKQFVGSEQSPAEKKQTTRQDSLQASAGEGETEKKAASPFSVAFKSPNQISPFDKIIKKYSRRYGFDWRLIAAQIFTESRFASDARSHVGAIGLMQILPSTAEHLGISSDLLLKPEQNIGLGCLYDRKLFNLWNDKKGTHRLAFTLASYNAGRTTVLRATSRVKAAQTWASVKPHLPYETQSYVTKIFATYEQYKTKYF